MLLLLRRRRRLPARNGRVVFGHVHRRNRRRYRTSCRGIHRMRGVSGMSRQLRGRGSRRCTVFWPEMGGPGLTVILRVVGGRRGHSLVTWSIAPRAAHRGVGVPGHGRIASRLLLRRRRRGGRGSGGERARRGRARLQHRYGASLLRDRLDQCSHDAFSSTYPSKDGRVLMRRFRGRRISTDEHAEMCRIRAKCVI